MQHVVVELLALTPFLDARNFLAERRVLLRSAKKIGLRKIPVVAVGVLGLNDDRTLTGAACSDGVQPVRQISRRVRHPTAPQIAQRSYPSGPEGGSSLKS